MLNFNTAKKFHLVGIGGVGMTPLALYLRESGFSVSGSDIEDFRMKDVLVSKGIKVNLCHNSANVPLDAYLIYSSAIPDNNIELLAARENNIPMFSRIEALKIITKDKKLIAITGSYGKSTLTTFISFVLEKANFNPSWIIGADLLNFNPAKSGEGKLFVLECDESRKEFLDFNPFFTLLTNIGSDHLSNYENSKDNLYSSILSFLARTDKEGAIFLNNDDILTGRVFSDLGNKVKIIKCGKTSSSDYIYEVKSSFFDGRKIVTNFTIMEKDGSIFNSQINMPGERNVIDACFSYAVLIELGFDKKKARDILKILPTLDRRFEIKKVSNKCIIIDDEGDSPDVIENVLRDIKFYFPFKKIVAVVQPHRYSRLKSLFSEYVRVLAFYPNDLILLPVYEASENKIAGIDSFSLANAIVGKNFRGKIKVASDAFEAVDFCKVYLNIDCAIITLGPGNIWKITNELSRG
jgi:UDP-N-acetylmuramate--alanine ligase